MNPYNQILKIILPFKNFEQIKEELKWTHSKVGLAIDFMIINITNTSLELFSTHVDVTNNTNQLQTLIIHTIYIPSQTVVVYTMSSKPLNLIPAQFQYLW